MLPIPWKARPCVAKPTPLCWAGATRKHWDTRIQSSPVLVLRCPPWGRSGPVDLQLPPSGHLPNYTDSHNSVNGWRLMYSLCREFALFTMSRSLIGRKTGIFQLSAPPRGDVMGQDTPRPSWRFSSLTSTLNLMRGPVLATLTAIDHELIGEEVNHKVSTFHSG